MVSPIEEELELRKQMWERLLEAGGPTAVEPKLLRELGIYGGAGGVWVNKERTQHLTDDGIGVTVGLLHTGSSYEDDLSESSLVYHYPKTDRARGRDPAEINATKACKVQDLPVFVIVYADRNLRDVHLAWVEDWDDRSGQFLVTFGNNPQTPPQPAPIRKFVLYGEGKTRKQREVAARKNQNRFRFQVRARYGPVCAVCPVDVPEVLQAAHIFEVQNGGSDHPGNGLVLCPTHHVAFDAGLFTFDPETTAVIYRGGGPGKQELWITRDDLTHLMNPPEPAAIRERFAKWGG